MSQSAIPPNVHFVILYGIVAILGLMALVSDNSNPGPASPVGQSNATGDATARLKALQEEVAALRSELGSVNRKVASYKSRSTGATASELRAIEQERQAFERDQAQKAANRQRSLQSERLRKERFNNEDLAERLDRDARSRAREAWPNR